MTNGIMLLSFYPIKHFFLNTTTTVSMETNLDEIVLMFLLLPTAPEQLTFTDGVLPCVEDALPGLQFVYTVLRHVSVRQQ